MPLRSAAAALWAVFLALLVASAAPPAADATITRVFSETATPVPCSTRSNGVRLCDQQAFQPARERSTVRAFDGVPLDVRVAFPAQPANGPDGPYPLMMLFHRFGGAKLPLQTLSWWLSRGYATLTMTERGFGESCGTQAARQADPGGCVKGYVRMMDTRYEVRDAQDLAGKLVDDGVVDPSQIGAIGNSYAGVKTIALAALKNRTMMPDGSLVPWTSPRGTPIALAGAASSSGWTDLVAALLPNGSTLDYVEDGPYTGRTGVLKESSENALYAFGLSFFYPPAGADPSADVTGWHALMHAGEPYDDSSGTPMPAVSALRHELTTYHSPYYIDDSEPPAPLLIANGWADDLMPADEAIRFYNRTRHRHLGVPISLFLADVGHRRGQNKPADANSVSTAQRAWLEHYVKGMGGTPFQGVQMRTQTCPPDAPSGGTYFAGSWAEAAAGEVAFQFPRHESISPAGGSASVAQTFDPYTGPGACATAPADDLNGTATYRSELVPGAGFTLLGSPTVVADITSAGSNSQVAARLLDVDPFTGTETLVARGLWRPAITDQPLTQVFQLHPNGYQFAADHVVKLELLPNDHPAYGRVSNGQLDVQISNVELRLPVREAPGALGGLVRTPAPKVLPPGSALQRDFAPPSYVRPGGATPLKVALVPAYRQCSAPNRTHGAPLSFGSCGPPVRLSPDLTLGTPDSNGEFANSVGAARFDVVVDDPETTADEADVRIGMVVTDVRRAGDLGDYTGELEGVAFVRITDRANGSGDEAATMADTALRAPLACAATGAANRGATCSVTTTFDALVPAAVQAGMRAVWEFDTVEVHDGGADGRVATAADNRPFARQGLFVP